MLQSDAAVADKFAPEACAEHDRRTVQPKVCPESIWAAQLGDGQSGMFWCVPGGHYVTVTLADEAHALFPLLADRIRFAAAHALSHSRSGLLGALLLMPEVL